MANLTGAELEQLWVANGGNAAKATIAAAVALAESGGNPQAVSSSHDYGLWQINSVNFKALGISAITALVTDVSARCAIIMSSNGANWAAWCTCWQDPDRDCGHGSLSVPQSGTPAGNELAKLGGVPGTGIGAALVASPTPNYNQVASTWGT